MTQSPLSALRATSPRRGRPPFVALARATSPVSSGEFTPKEEARFVLLSLRGKRSDEANSREGEFPCHRVNEKTKCVIATLALAKIRKFRL